MLLVAGPSLRLSTLTASNLKELLQRWRAVGGNISGLIGLNMEPETRAPRVPDFRHFALQIGTYRYYSKNAFFLKAPTPLSCHLLGSFALRT